MATPILTPHKKKKKTPENRLQTPPTPCYNRMNMKRSSYLSTYGGRAEA